MNHMALIFNVKELPNLSSDWEWYQFTYVDEGIPQYYATITYDPLNSEKNEIYFDLFDKLPVDAEFVVIEDLENKEGYIYEVLDYNGITIAERVRLNSGEFYGDIEESYDIMMKSIEKGERILPKLQLPTIII